MRSPGEFLSGEILKLNIPAKAPAGAGTIKSTAIS